MAFAPIGVVNAYRSVPPPIINGPQVRGSSVAQPSSSYADISRLRMGSIRMRTSRSGRFHLGRMWLNIVAEDELKSALNETTRVFGERVRDRRGALGLSQEAAAVRCGIHWTQLGKVERGQRSLRLETIVKIAHGLDIDPGDLVRQLPVPQT
jgi:DNA-binding XRE family transcriptional regulator